MTTETKLTKRQDDQIEKTSAEHKVLPLVDIYENQDEILLIADMPGVATQDLGLRVDKDVLNLEGRTSYPNGKGLLRCESEPCVFARSFTIPHTIDADKISASLEKGVLTVHLPKREAIKPRQIPVSAG